MSERGHGVLGQHRRTVQVRHVFAYVRVDKDDLLVVDQSVYQLGYKLNEEDTISLCPKLIKTCVAVFECPLAKVLPYGIDDMVGNSVVSAVPIAEGNDEGPRH